ncbi:MAG: acyl-CoA dehydrogenase, partial [Archaeoglobi archaeon]
MMRTSDFYDVEELLSDEDRLVKSSIREFLEKEIRPLVVDAWHEEKPLNFRQIARRFGELGMLGTFISEDYGCPGMSYTTFGIV